ncbi:family 20 glycosylhydrolase [Bacteroides sp. 519]|uniref:family 20 glycosylhydrolase n=1 Tax=Bacteroides sp. 519 TaxID=2302937 RepID=UPI0013D03F25|nr:family 20 glycosylhydrolase [Bacteroides sp. 519]NDV59539.1 beta-N-acetylhexosaminidase [Bacteroides sp. 519]
MRKELILLLLIFMVSCADNEKTEVNIIPHPVELTVNQGGFKLTKQTQLSYSDPALKSAAEYLNIVLKSVTGQEYTVSQQSKEGISLHVDASLSTEDAYTLNVTNTGIQITGSNPQSVMLGIQTLRQLIPVKTDNTIRVQNVSITDSPKWKWRGMMLDVSRHFFDKNEVKRFLDIMAQYKFNKFHWHLTDDQGWRVEIKKYPLLTEKGAWRTANNHDRGCIDLAEKQSNTDYLLQEDKLRNNGTEYGGYYTQEEIREVVAYAAMLGIDVIPEIDMPGHFSAAISQYSNLACFEKAGWGKVFSAPICPGKDATLEFCKDIFKEIFELFPNEYVHMGADEVDKTNWIKCPHCQARIKNNKLKDEKELQSWFVHQMEDFLNENGKKLIGWDEILEGGMSKSATMMWWRTWAKKAVHEATAQGNEVILTPNSHYYFDYQQDYSTLRKLYEFQPLPKGLSAEETKLVKGLQANVWAEWIPSRKRQDYMTMPRMFALSEVAWSQDKDLNWDNFYQRLLAHYPRMDAMGINYRPLDLNGVHVSNSFVGETTVTWDYPLSTISIRYTTDGTTPNENSSLYTAPFTINETTDFTIRLFRPDGSAADIIKTSYRKEEYIIGEEQGNKIPGLKCEWHEAVVNKSAEIETIPVKAEFVVNEVVIPEGVTNHKQAMKYIGYLKIDKEDIYTFSLGSDDGSMLYINNEVVVDNDGPHGPRTLRGQKALGKGYHPIVVYYFDMNNGGFVELNITDSDNNEIKNGFFYIP